MQLVAPAAVELRQGLEPLHVGLADQQPLGVVTVRDLPPPAQDVVRLGPVGVVDGPHAHELLVERVVLGDRRVVAQLLVLDHHVAHVDAEPGHAPVPPKAQDIVELSPHVLAPPVQVGLGRLEVVQEVLPARLVELPGRTAEDAHPVVGRAPVGLGVRPHVVVAVCRLATAERVDEPRVLVAGVVRHEVHEDPDAPLARQAHERVEVVERPVGGVDAAVVRDVVPPVAVRRAGHRRQPQGGDPKSGKVVELGNDAAQVAHPVAAGIGVGAGVDLVEDAALPPAVRARLVHGRHRRPPCHGAFWRGRVPRERTDRPPSAPGGERRPPRRPGVPAPRLASPREVRYVWHSQPASANEAPRRPVR